jgi:hypothetical protein
MVTIRGINEGSDKKDTISLNAYNGGGTSNYDFTSITSTNNYEGTVRLNAEQFTKIRTKLSFEIVADKPIIVGQFMDNIVSDSQDGNGDPSFILNVPREQYRSDYSFSIPENYTYDYVTIISPAGNKIKYTGSGYEGVAYDDMLIDSLPSKVFSGWKKFGTHGYVYGYLALDSGVHSLKADHPFGAIGYGTYGATSYGYPIGLNLDRINNTN